VIEIEEAAFILEIPTKIVRANHIAFIQAIFGRAAIGSSKHVRTRRSASLRGGAPFRPLEARRPSQR
jgi:hypothetical protein